MAVWTLGTGAAGQMRLELIETSTNAGANTSQVRVIAQLYTPPGSVRNDPVPWSLAGSLSASGGFTFGSGGGWQTLYDSTVTAGHAADGSGAFPVQFSIGATGTSGVGGPTTMSVSMNLTTLTVKPGTPTGVSAVRNSDTSVTVSWTRNYASHGVPTQTIVEQSVNGGSWSVAATLGNVASVAVASAANRKTIYRVRQSNSAGASTNSSSSSPVYTTPAAPTGAAAVRSGLNIALSWVNKAGYSEYQTQVWHGTVSGGVTTWDASPLTTVAAGVTSYTHNSPNPAQVHVYRVRARTSSGTALFSGYSTSGSVQLLTAPNAPTLANLPTRLRTIDDLTVSWTHNSVDTSPQKAYELQWSTNAGSTWFGTGKVASASPSRVVAAGTHPANASVVFRVRTWGDATTGGSDGTGASAWSATDTVTYQTQSVLSITDPVDGEVLETSAVTVTLGFAQAEGGTFVSGVVTLIQGGEAVETVNTTSLEVPLSSKLADGGNYTIEAVATDSWGLTSTTATIAIAVDYPEPATPTVTAGYIPESGMVAITIEDTMADPAPVSAVITRTIAGVVETVGTIAFDGTAITVMDTTPTIAGVNLYQVVSYTADGAASPAAVTSVTTTEEQWAFLSGGPGFTDFVRFYSHLSESAEPGQDVTLVKPAGRSIPLALYGEGSTLAVTVSAMIRFNEGSTVFEIEQFLRTCKRVCYRSPSGRRVLGAVTGTISGWDGLTADLALTLSEAT